MSDLHRHTATVAPIIAHIYKTCPQAKRLSQMVDANGQLCLDHRDLDYIPHAELEKVDRWLESKLDDFEAAASNQVGLQTSPPYLASHCFLLASSRHLPLH